LDKALSKYDQGDREDCNFTEPDWENAELDISDNPTPMSGGVCIEERS